MKSGDIIVSNKDVPYALNLFFTGKCNLNCNYCFVNKNGIENTTLNEDSLKKSVDLLFKYPGKRKTISFNGGEPTLEWNLVRKIYDYAKKRARKNGIILDVSVMTNGTLLNQEIVNYLIKNKIIVKISIDGDKFSHDKNRPFKFNKKESSFDKIIDNLKKIKTDNLNMAASMVFTPQTIDNLLKNIKFLNNKNFRYIEIYPDLYADWNKKSLKKMEKSFKEFESYYVGLFKNAKNKKFKNSLLDMFVNDIEIDRMKFCGKIHISAEGNYYACDKVFSLNEKERKKYIVGSVISGIDKKKREIILNNLRSDFFRKSGLKCETCKYSKYCFCPIGHYIYFLNNKNYLEKEFWKSFCSISKIYNETYLRIREKLKYNPDFIKLYRY